jgi:hypothetical protein
MRDGGYGYDKDKQIFLHGEALEALNKRRCSFALMSRLTISRRSFTTCVIAVLAFVAATLAWPLGRGTNERTRYRFADKREPIQGGQMLC